MKKIFFSIALLSITSLTMAANIAAVDPNMAVNNSRASLTNSLNADPVVKAYLLVKDALVASDAKTASQAGSALFVALEQLQKEAATTAQRSAFNKDGRAALKTAQAIGKTGDIKEQRKAFKELSEHLYQLIKITGSSASLYWDYCPMAKASWLSDKKPISNPYYGKSMLSCGSVKETLTP